MDYKRDVFLPALATGGDLCERSAAEAEAARRQVAACAADAEDCTNLLDALGLLESSAPAPYLTAFTPVQLP
ncbi:hypothetical protein ACIQWN_37130 [Streptomyces vinaceus]|uniref:hypothetical protein n=1 Tax=Streptomyces vinaceus TaxID=1960 RepID=UPI00382CEDD6